jgi:hypothetical protein
VPSDTVTVARASRLLKVRPQAALPDEFVDSVVVVGFEFKVPVVANGTAVTDQFCLGSGFAPNASVTALETVTLATNGALVNRHAMTSPLAGMVTVPVVPVPAAPVIGSPSTVQLQLEA